MLKKYFILLVILAGVYLLITFSIPPDPATLARFNVSTAQLRLLSLSVAAPLIAIWLAAFYGFSRFKAYAAKIKDSPDGKGLDRLANGLMVLALGLPVAAILSALINYSARVNPDSAPVLVTLNTYLTIAFPLIGFLMIWQGAGALVKTVKSSPQPVWNITYKLIFLALAAGYAYLVLTNPQRHVPQASGRQPFYIPDWAILVTVVIPYIVVWYSGVRSALAMIAYQTNVPGTLYKRALSLLSAGLVAVIVSSILTQLLGVATASLSRLTLGPLLAIVYVLLIVIAMGYVLIAQGARRLTQIEEVIYGATR